MLAHDAVSQDTKQELCDLRERVDPVALLHAIREAQPALAAIGQPEPHSAIDRVSLEQFLSRLPELWRKGEVRPTHEPRPRPARTWRTRADPFEGVWWQVLLWLQPPAKSLFERLRLLHPERFTAGQLRTLQRRVREWRVVMAQQLV